jgi:Undecaprenyl-phosphate glucose phosphotransferase
LFKRRNQIMVAIFVVADLSVTLLSFLLAYVLRFEIEGIRSAFEIQHVPPMAAFLNKAYLITITLAWLLVFHFNGLYNEPKRGRSMIDEVFSIISSVILATILLLGFNFFYRKPGYDVSRSFMLIFILLDVVLVSAVRISLRASLNYLRKKGFNQKKVHIAGAGVLGTTFLRKLNSHPHLGFSILGFLDDDQAKVGTQIEGVKVLATLDAVEQVIEELLPDQLYIALPHSAYRRTLEIFSRVQKECVAVKFIPDLLGYMSLKASVEDLDGLPIINISESPFAGWNGMLKRIMDIGLSLVCMIISLPLTAAIAILIKATSRGPIFYSQERMGMDGKSFMIYKFRSMIVDAEHYSGPKFAEKDDPRVTRLGAFLRRYSLDELPQLINVLKGNMSLVGPRPERPLFVARFREQIPRYMLRHKVKAGMTGWAQIHGLRGSETSMEVRVEYDLYYIKNWSLKLDLIILLMTLIRFKRIHQNAF